MGKHTGEVLTPLWAGVPIDWAKMRCSRPPRRCSGCKAAYPITHRDAPLFNLTLCKPCLSLRGISHAKS